jgi:hypothetical protein
MCVERIGYVSRLDDVNAQGRSRWAAQIDDKIRVVKADEAWIELDKLVIKSKSTGIGTKTCRCNGK